MTQDPIRSQILEVAQAAEDLASSVRTLLSVYDGDNDYEVSVPGQGIWNAEMMEVLFTKVFGPAIDLPGDEYPADNDVQIGIRALLDATADKAGEWVSFSQIMERSGLSQGTQRFAHIDLSRIVKAAFTRNTWPVEAKQESKRADKPTAEMIYRMPPQVAQWWRQLWATEEA